MIVKYIRQILIKDLRKIFDYDIPIESNIFNLLSIVKYLA